MCLSTVTIRIYIGGRDEGHKDYRWPNGNNFDFADWDSNQPEGGKDDYVCLGKNDRKWHDAQCDHAYQFICTV